MKKAIACLLVLPLTLAACGAQTTQPAPTTAPEMTTEATTENGKAPRRAPARHRPPDGCAPAFWRLTSGSWIVTMAIMM